MKISKFQFLIFSLILLLPFRTIAQCMMVPLSLSQRVSSASTIVLGKVLQRNSYRATNNHIYTSNLIQVKAYLKGVASHESILVISEGGVLEDNAEMVYPSLELESNQDVILMLLEDNTAIDNKHFRITYPGIPQMEAYASAQGMLTLQNGLFHDIFSEEPFSEEVIVKKISRLSGLTAVTPNGKTYISKPHQYRPKNNAKIAAISNVTPNPGVAGTIAVADQLTITGSGFGAVAGTVEFNRADDGGATQVGITNPSDIISWSDVQIVVKVPRRAGTGTVTVNSTFSAPYTVNYSHIEINNNFSGFASTTRQRYYLVNKDGSGGYTFQYNTGFASNAPAVAAFERALATWRCNTFVNFRISSTTTAIVSAANDGVNVVSFDPSLPAGVLGRATSQFGGNATGGCNLANTVWFASDIDIQFQDPPTAGFTWNYGPVASIPFGTTYDFESVALHELGHAHGLGHIISTGSVMHYSLFNGADARTLNASSDIAGGNAKMAYSTTPYCFNPPGVTGAMVALTGGNCALSVSLLSFKGTRKNSNHHLLEWTTTDERDNFGFILSKSTDGIHFDSIGFVNASKDINNIKNYSYNYYANSFANITYYQLSQIDLNGRRTNFPIITIHSENKTNESIYYNSEDKTIYLAFSSPLESEAVWALYNVNGQLIAKEKIALGSLYKNFLIPSICSGIYSYTLTGNSIAKKGKLMID